jgi:hypothetical protein
VELLRSSGFPRLDESALHSVRRYRFTPVMQGLQAIRVWTTVYVSFDLLPMPVPVTMVGFDETVAEQIALATRMNSKIRGYRSARVTKPLERAVCFVPCTEHSPRRTASASCAPLYLLLGRTSG